MNIEDLVFVGFNSRVAALDQQTGEIVWDWSAPRGWRYVSLLLDGPRLFVAIAGYTYCLDAVTGQQLWTNPMTGFGLGVTSLVSARGAAPPALLGQASSARRRAAVAAAAAG